MLTRAQKEKRVIELYKQGKNVREIAQIMHMSFGPICSIIRKDKGEDAATKDPEKEGIVKSKYTEALELFEQGVSPVQIAIRLDIRVEEVKRIYKEYLELKGIRELNRVYDEVGDDISSFVRFYYDSIKAGVGLDRIGNALYIVEQLPSIERKYQILRKDF